MARAVRILHLHSTFSLGGKEARSVRLMNAFGDAAEHVIVSAMPGRLDARKAIDPGIIARFPSDVPPLTGLPTPGRMRLIARYMQGHDLVLTYNWGAFDAVAARRMLAPVMRLPPIIHHEDGFNEDEAEALKSRRNIYRRLGLPAAYRLVVPSQTLEKIARNAWGAAPIDVEHIPNGIPVGLYAAPPEPGAIPGLDPRAGGIVIGTVAGLRKVKNLPRLVRAFAAIERPDCRLVIVGAGPEAEAIAAEARVHGVADRVILPGFLADPHRWIGHFDIFALSSDSEQAPISLMEAMAAGLPVAATAVGDVADMVSAENRPLIVKRRDEYGLAASLDALVEQADLRRTIGAANRARAGARFDEAAMIARYAALYGEAIGRPDAFIAQPR
jgi:L-malate glycosyltransferase